MLAVEPIDVRVILVPIETEHRSDAVVTDSAEEARGPTERPSR